MSVSFHSLAIAEIVDETAEAKSIRFDVPAELRETFRFKPGQHLTLKAEIGGEEVRRNYSLCVAPQDGELKVTVKRIAGGLFSNWANDNLKPGDPIEVMPPHGSFTWDFAPGAANHYVGFAGGSGITPVMSLLKTALLDEPDSRFTLLLRQSRQPVGDLPRGAGRGSRTASWTGSKSIISSPRKPRISTCSTACSTAPNATRCSTI